MTSTFKFYNQLSIIIKMWQNRVIPGAKLYNCSVSYLNSFHYAWESNKCKLLYTRCDDYLAQLSLTAKGSH